MASKVDIINLALTRLQEQPINAVDEGSEASNIVGRVYDICLASELREWPWPFATTTVSLAGISSETPPDFSGAWQLPADYLKMVEIINPSTGYYYYQWTPWKQFFNNEYEWEVREGKLYINIDASTGTLTTKYVKLQTDTTKWDASFTDMFAWRIAKEIAIGLTGRADAFNNAMQGYMLSKQTARGMAGSETHRTTDLGRKWLNARR